MIRRRGVPDGGCGMCCRLKEKLEYLWDHTMGAIKSIRNITPDGDGNFDIQAGNNIEITPVSNGLSVGLQSPLTDDLEVHADVIVDGDIIQRGSSYKTHAQHVFSTDDYIVMRDGALVGLAQGDYSGFLVKKYDGVNDGRLVIDRDGVARVGDVGDEQPLLTRDEASVMSNGHLLMWDGANDKAVTYNGELCRSYTGNRSFSASVWRSDVTAPPDFPYSAELQVSADLTGGDDEYPIVSFSPYNTENALFAPFCDVFPAQGSDLGGLKIYASALPTTQTSLTYMIIKKVTH